MAKSQNSNLHGILKCPNSIFHSQFCGSLKNQDLAITVTLRTSCQVVPEQGRGSLELLKIPILRHFHCFFFFTCLEAWWKASFSGHVFTWPGAGGDSGKEPTCQCRRLRDMGSIPELGRSPRGWHGNPLCCSCLENPMDRAGLQTTVHRIAKSQTWLKWLSTHRVYSVQKSYSKSICWKQVAIV